MLVKLALVFEADITIQCSERLANAKSILSVLSLCAAHGDVVKVTVEGPDADEAIQALSTLFAQGFDDVLVPHSSAQQAPGRWPGGDSRPQCLSPRSSTLAAASR